jgi:SAM-dependent methyltransferase
VITDGRAFQTAGVLIADIIQVKRRRKLKHPAKYSDVLLPVFKEMLSGCEKILDPFAGTGKLRLVFPDCTLLEIEPEWAAMSSGAIVGDATNMPFADCSFDAICTSPTYGNRMADSFIDHQTEKQYKRNTYTHVLGRKLSANNSGAMQWGERYREFHLKAWAECSRVLKPKGLFCLNISNHIRKGKEQYVTEWHIEALVNIGFSVLEHRKIKTRRNRMGRNGNVRVQHESVVLLRKGGK